MIQNTSLCRKLLPALIAAVLALSSGVSLRAAGNAQEEDVVGRFLGAGRGSLLGKPHLAITAEVNGRNVSLLVPNVDESKSTLDPNPRMAEFIHGLKPGDTVMLTAEGSQQGLILKGISAYDLKPGEDTPNGFIYKSNYDEGQGKNKVTLIELSKLGHKMTLPAATRKNEKGEIEADPDVLAALNDLKTNDPVWVDATGNKVNSIELYKEPQAGKLVKVADSTVDGHKVTSAEVEGDGKTVTLLVPGKLNGKTWVPDVNVLKALRKLRNNAQVLYRAREDGDKLWLREINPAPKAAPEPKAPKEKEQRRGTMKEKN